MPSTSPESHARLVRALREHPDAMIMELARTHAVSELEVLAVLGPPRAVPLDATRWEALLRALPALGAVRVIVSNAGVTTETRGTFGGFSLTGDYFNVQTASLDMHLRWAAIGGAMAVEKPSHQTGRPTASIQLFDHDGHAILKIFLVFGEREDDTTARRQAFAALRETFAR